MNAAALNNPDLPDDVEALKKLIIEQQRILEKKDSWIEQKDKQIEQKDKQIEQKEKWIQALEELVRLHKLKKFGASSEKSADQEEMFNEAELTVEAEAGLQAEENALHERLPKSARPGKPRRKPLPADLPRVRIEHDLPDSEKRCACGCERTEIGEITSEQLDIIPAKVQVLVHVRKQYACRRCEEGINTATLPPQPYHRSRFQKAMPALACWPT